MNRFANTAIRQEFCSLKSLKPYNSIESLKTLVDENLSLSDDKDYAVLNKPPGFVTLGKVFLAMIN